MKTGYLIDDEQKDFHLVIRICGKKTQFSFNLDFSESAALLNILENGLDHADEERGKVLKRVRKTLLTEIENITAANKNA